MLFKNVKARTLWILTGVDFVVTMGIIYLCTVVPKEYKTVCIVFMAIGFLTLTFLVQWASMKSFKFKAKKDPVYPKEYTGAPDFYEILKKNKFKERVRSYGISFLKIDKPDAYKVTLVRNSEAYFNPSDSDTTEGEKELDKCERMICFEVFLDYKPEDIEKMGDYSIQAKNIYYTAFYKKDDTTYVCANYLKPDDVHEKNYEYLMNLFELKEKIEIKEDPEKTEEQR